MSAGSSEYSSKKSRYGISNEYTEPKHKLHPLIYDLRKRRLDIRMSQRLLADKMGYSFDAIRRWESGLAFPGFYSLICWAQCLGVSIKIDVGGENRNE